MTVPDREPYGTDERITIPVTSELAASLAAEVYLPAKQRSVSLLRIGTTDLGHWRVVEIMTQATSGGYRQIVATYQRILL